MLSLRPRQPAALDLSATARVWRAPTEYRNVGYRPAGRPAPRALHGALPLPTAAAGPGAPDASAEEKRRKAREKVLPPRQPALRAHGRCMTSAPPGERRCWRSWSASPESPKAEKSARQLPTQALRSGRSWGKKQTARRRMTRMPVHPRAFCQKRQAANVCAHRARERGGGVRGGPCARVHTHASRHTLHAYAQHDMFGRQLTSMITLMPT